MGLGPLTMSSMEPSLRLLPPWERSVSTVSCMFPSWGQGMRVRKHTASQPGPQAGSTGHGGHGQRQLGDAKNEG